MRPAALALPAALDDQQRAFAAQPSGDDAARRRLEYRPRRRPGASIAQISGPLPGRGTTPRVRDEAYPLIRQAPTVSGDICPRNGELLIRLDPLTTPRRTQAPAAPCNQLNQAQARHLGTGLALRYEVNSHPPPA
jgi:hypothetical protein